MSKTYKSLFERYISELDEQGAIVELSVENSMQILQELHEGMEEFVQEQKVKDRRTEQELASIVLL